MKLRGRLLLVTGGVLLLPLLGLQFVAEVERTLRRGLEQTAVDAATALAAAAPEPASGSLGRSALYVQQAGQPLRLDGYGDDWSAWLALSERFGPAGRRPAPAADPLTPDAPLSLALADASGGFHLLLRMLDEQTRFSRSPEEPGEVVELTFVGAGREGTVRLAPAAPGRFVRSGAPSGWPTVIGEWQVRAQGWSLEMRIVDREPLDRLGLAVTDRDGDGLSRVYSIDDPVALLRRDPTLSESLARLVPAGLHVWMVSQSGYVLAEVDRRAAGGSAGGTPNRLQTMLFERLAGDALSIRSGESAEAVRLTGADLDAAREATNQPIWAIDPSGARVRVAVPLSSDRPDGSLLVVERDADALLLLASDAVIRLAGVSLLTFLGAAGVVLAFATWLSLRIRRLQRAAEQAVGDDGRVVGGLQPARGDDELAALSRSMGSLLERLRVHQQYLRTLADRLAHELRTPLAMIGSSLDNLEQQLDGSGSLDRDQARRTLARAGQGSRRLQRILAAMSQAERLEDALFDEPFTRFDLAGMVREYCEARAAGLADRVVEPPDSGAPVPVRGSSDLIAQLLDKLFDNAVDFAPVGGRIRIGVGRDGRRAVVTVDNEGQAIDAGRSASLFEPMVSHRTERGEQPHLGMGLFIASLIAERHRGRVELQPLKHGTRAVFEMPLDRSGESGQREAVRQR